MNDPMASNARTWRGAGERLVAPDRAPLTKLLADVEAAAQKYEDGLVTLEDFLRTVREEAPK